MKKNLPFHPLDNSSSTRMKYDLEAAHWARAYDSYKTNNTKPDYSGVAGLIGSVLIGVGCILFAICTFLVWGIKKLVK